MGVLVTGPEPHGRLELTWANKADRLLAHEDGRYEWTDPGDHRIAEVRLLHTATTVGDGPATRAAGNLLLRGDALHGLRALARLPEFSRELAGQVRLAYIDPPFNTRRAFEHYDDGLEHSVWLTMMRDRLLQVRELLALDGSVYVHCDSSESHYLKVLMDEIFGRSNFRTEIIWKRTAAHSDARTWGEVTDSIFFYTRSADLVWHAAHLAHDEEYLRKKYNRTDPDGRPYGLWDLQSPSPRQNLMYPWQGFSPPKNGWRFSRERMQKLHDDDRIYYPEDRGKRPRLKRYADESLGRLVDNLWIDIPPVNSQASEDSGYSTQKPERLIERIIAASSEPGDIVLDCFLGSGTTAAVAQKMGRRWIGIERSRETVADFAVPRLTAVAAGSSQGGIARHAEADNDGFVVLDVAESMFALDGDRVVLASWATGGALAEAVCAQSGWDCENVPPFSGRKGRMRLAVVDGLVTEDVALLLAGWLDTDEQLTIYGTAVDPEAGPALSGAYRGSSVRQIPQSILADYRRERRSEIVDWLNVLEVDTDTIESAESITTGGS